MVKVEWRRDEFVMDENKNNDVESVFDGSFIWRLGYVCASGLFGTFLYIAFSFSNWENLPLNYLLSVLALVTLIPLSIKAIFLDFKYGEFMSKFIEVNKTPDGFTYKVLIDFLGAAATISLCYTSLGFVRFSYPSLEVLWPFILALCTVILITFSGINLIDLIIRLGMLTERKINNLFLLIFIAALAFVIQYVFFEIGIEAVGVYKKSVDDI